jgi:hypothetical protein
MELEAGRTGPARLCFDEALEVARELDVAWLVAEVLIALAATDVLDSRPERVEGTLRKALSLAGVEPGDRL